MASQKQNNVDRRKLTVEQIAQLDQWEASQKSLSKLGDIETAVKGIEVKPVVNVAPAEVNIPEIKVPDVHIPEIKLPIINVPEIKAPVIPEIKVPDIHIPEIRVPDINVPAPKVTVKPQVSIPTGSSGFIYVDGKPYEPQYAPVEVASPGYVEVVEAVKNKKIRVMACFLMASDDTDFQFLSGIERPLTGSIRVVESAGFVWPFNQAGWTETSPGQALVLEETQRSLLGGLLTYILI